MDAIVDSCNACWVLSACPGMSTVLRNNKLQISLGKVELFYLLLVVTHPGKLPCYHVVLVGFDPACPKFSEITNH